jgi:hypothetical protein
MSNENPIVVNSAHLAALTPAGRTQFADALAKHGGYSADKIAAALGAPPAPIVPC